MYEYFMSFVVAKERGYDYGNINISCPHKILNIEEIRWMELRIKEETKAKQVIILNYQLLRKKNKEE